MAGNTIQKGRNLQVSIGGKYYGFATSCDINISMETKEIAYKSPSGMWKEQTTETLSWDVNSEHLATVEQTDEKALFAAMTAGEPVAIEFSSVTYGADNAATKGTLLYKGNAIITSFKLSAAKDGDATYSISLQGTGELTNTAV